MNITEGDLATLIWRACLDAGQEITVTASRHAARAALQAFAQGIARDDLDRWAPPPRPALMVELHENVADWSSTGLLAAALRRHADRLDRRAHDACVAEAWGTDAA